MNIDEIAHIADQLRGANLRRYSTREFNSRLTNFLGDYQPIRVGRNIDQVWWRARRCPADGYSNLREMLYPPETSVGYGRANLPKTPVLYASWNALTTLAEVPLIPGDHVQLIAVRPRAGIVVPSAVVGEIAFYHNNGHSLINSVDAKRQSDRFIHSATPDALTRRLFVDSFLSEQYAKPVKHAIEYRLSAEFANRYTSQGTSLIYPSVESRGAVNIAVPADRFDRDFEVMETVVYRIESYLGYHYFMTIPVLGSAQFESDGEIDWASSRQATGSHAYSFGVRYNQGQTGWRVPRQD